MDTEILNSRFNDTDGIIDFIPTSRVFPVGHDRNSEAIVATTALEARSNACLALLTQAAMERTAALSVMANRLASIAPNGNQFYAMFVAEFAKKTLEHLEERW